MEDWVHRALARWPNVPALFDWLGLDRRGRWLIRGEIITRPQIVDTIKRNYAADEQGRWYFQNGPQRGYVALDYAPLVLRAGGDDQPLLTHTDLPVTWPEAAWLDQEGSLLLSTEHGPGLLLDADLPWALQRLCVNRQPVREEQLADAMALPSGTLTALHLRLGELQLPLTRLDTEEMPVRLGFVRRPQPNDDAVSPSA